MDRANDWLKKNGDVQVKTCESVTWMSRDSKEVSDSELMVLSKRVSDNGATYCVRGLRCVDPLGLRAHDADSACRP